MPQKMLDSGAMMNISFMIEDFLALQLNYVSVCLYKKRLKSDSHTIIFYTFSRTGVVYDDSRHLSCISINGH